MIIFGWRSFVTNIGTVFKKMCDHCHNEKDWVLTRVTRWFTLFFIPIFPVSWKYFFACPICKYGFTLNTEQVNIIKPIAELNQLLASGQITETEYQTRLNLLNKSNDTVSERTEKIETVVESEKETPTYCIKCGSLIDKDAKFCGSCGTNVNNK